jgi:hypothetical protein
MNFRTFAKLSIKISQAKLKKLCSHKRINQEDKESHSRISSRFLSEVSIINIKSNNCSGLF